MSNSLDSLNLLNPVFRELLVCRTCRPAGAARDGPAEGELPLAQVLGLHSASARPACTDAARIDGVVVRGIACLSASSRSCTVALQAGDEMTYVFGDLLPDAESAAQVLDCAHQHARAPDGLLAWASRPDRLRRGIVTRLPPCQLRPPCAREHHAQKEPP